MANVTVYVITDWQNLPNQSTPINASNLKHLENGVKALTDFINTINAESGLYLCATPFLSADRTKLDGIEAQANNYVLPTASELVLGGVKVDGTTITIQNGIISASASATTLAGLTDTNITDLANGQVLTYDATSSKWKNVTLQIATALASLTDVVLSNPSDGQVLKYNGTVGKWVNGTASTVGDLDDLTDVDITSPSDGQILKYDATAGKWINGTGGSGGASSLDDLTDVDITSPAEGDILKYDGSDWVNAEGVEILDYYGTLEILGLPANPRYDYRIATPIMTSDTTPSGECICSSYYPSSGPFNPYQAFQQLSDNNVGWVSNTDDVVGAWIGYIFDSATIIRRLEVISRSQSSLSRIVKSFKVQGSNDGTTWTDLKTCSGIENIAGKSYQFDIDNSTPYTRYRLYVLESWDGRYVGFGTINMYERYLA